MTCYYMTHIIIILLASMVVLLISYRSLVPFAFGQFIITNNNNNQISLSALPVISPTKQTVLCWFALLASKCAVRTYRASGIVVIRYYTDLEAARLTVVVV